MTEYEWRCWQTPYGDWCYEVRLVGAQEPFDVGSARRRQDAAKRARSAVTYRRVRDAAPWRRIDVPKDET